MGIWVLRWVSYTTEGLASLTHFGVLRRHQPALKWIPILENDQKVAVIIPAMTFSTNQVLDHYPTARSRLAS